MTFLSSSAAETEAFLDLNLSNREKMMQSAMCIIPQVYADDGLIHAIKSKGLKIP